ncbi:hypothetical protein [Nocardia cyriacigeorgica]|uniref:FeoB-associated Cys-rich membrane protein n=1 Tax=Nocardia cyriacigeorgica TaxID=135487 RepID=A0A5R8NB50_9NOCA|nr:hypothetical protein [Nocardia cyriacigeorgica]TLF72888.1 hypothetical protein FEK34_28100 [Nocardia cyriacigeorgica]
MTDILEIALGGIYTIGGLAVVVAITIGIIDNWLHPGSHECPICKGVGCRHCGGGDVDDAELLADEDDDGDEFEGDEWDRARDRDLDREVA